MTETTRAVFKIEIKGTLEKVFREITKTGGANETFFNMRMHVDAFKPGGKLRMRTLDGKYTGVVGEILEYDPPRRFAHTFKFTHLDDPPCKMIYELREIPGGVEFTLIAEGVPVGTKSAKDIASGGTMIINTLKAMVETGRPTFGTRMLYVMIKVMTPFTTPKICRSENWP